MKPRVFKIRVAREVQMREGGAEPQKRDSPQPWQKAGRGPGRRQLAQLTDSVVKRFGHLYVGGKQP